MPLSMSFPPYNLVSINFVQTHYLLRRMLLSILRNFQKDLTGRVGIREYYHILHTKTKPQMDGDLFHQSKKKGMGLTSSLCIPLLKIAKTFYQLLARDVIVVVV